jgi:hypothetical protein
VRAVVDTNITGDEDLLVLPRSRVFHHHDRRCVEAFGPFGFSVVLREQVTDVPHDFRDALFLLQDAGGELWWGGRCVMSSLARGFLRSRLQPLASSSVAGAFRRSFLRACPPSRPARIPRIDAAVWCSSFGLGRGCS